MTISELERISHEHPIMLYDGVCGFCDRAVQTILRYQKSADVRFISLQSDAGQIVLDHLGLSQDELSTVVLIKDGKYYLKSDVTVHTAPLMKAPWSWLRWIRWIPKSIRDGLYDVIAKNRYRLMGQLDHCRIPKAAERHQFLSVA